MFTAILSDGYTIPATQPAPPGKIVSCWLELVCRFQTSVVGIPVVLQGAGALSAF